MRAHPSPEKFLSEEQKRRLSWRCRRGLLENDLLIQKFFAQYSDSLSAQHYQGLEELMALSDPELLDLLLARHLPDLQQTSPAVLEVLELFRKLQNLHS